MFQLRRRPQVVAHRGFSGAYPENTRSAILGAIAVGADMVEIDVRLSSDGVPMVFHDAVLTASGQSAVRIEEMTAAELCALDLAQAKGPRFVGERILTLNEALLLVHNQIPINLDIKTAQALAPTIQLLQTRRMIDQAVLSGCSGAYVRCVRQQEPQLHVLMNVDDYLRTFLRLCSARVALLVSWLQAHMVQATGLNISHRIAADQFIRSASLRNVPVWTWTVDDPRRARKLAALGAVSVTTNWPDRIIAAFPNR
jgi:glycerophosphoryl diester phosphodiesterase